MEINRYIAWDGNEYQGQPPAGWYQASDGRWWPEGYGPPPAPPQPDDEFRTAPAQGSTTSAAQGPAVHQAAPVVAESGLGADDGQQYEATAHDRNVSLVAEAGRVEPDGSVPYRSEPGPAQHQTAGAVDQAAVTGRSQPGRSPEEIAPLEFPWSPPRTAPVSAPAATDEGSTTTPRVTESHGHRAGNAVARPEPDELAATQAAIAELTGVSIEASQVRVDGAEGPTGRFEQSDYESIQNPGSFPGPGGSGGTGARRDAIAERARSRFDQMSERINESEPRSDSSDVDNPAGKGFRTVDKPSDEAPTGDGDETGSPNRNQPRSAPVDSHPPGSLDPSTPAGAPVSDDRTSSAAPVFDPSVSSVGPGSDPSGPSGAPGSSVRPAVPANADSVLEERVTIVERGAAAAEERVATIQTGSTEGSSAVQARLAELTTIPADQNPATGNPYDASGQTASTAPPRTASDLFNNLTGRSSEPVEDLAGPAPGVNDEIVDTHEPADPAAAVSLAVAAAAATGMSEGNGVSQPPEQGNGQSDQNGVREPGGQPEPAQTASPILDPVQRDTPTLDLPRDQLMEGELPEGITRLPAGDMAGLRANSNPAATVGIDRQVPGPLDAPTANPFQPGYEPGSSAASLNIDAPPVAPQPLPDGLTPPENSGYAVPDPRVGSPGDFSAPVVAGASMARAPEPNRAPPAVPGPPSYADQAYPNHPGSPDPTDSAERGSRKGLRLMGIALIILVIGILGYLAWLLYSGQGFRTDLGGRSEPTAATATVGSVSDPYDSSQAVSLYYEADGAEQRWAVKSEPLTEADAEQVSAADAGDGNELVGVNLVVVFQSGSESRNIDELVFKAVDTNGAQYDAVACPSGEALPTGLVVTGQRVAGTMCWAVPSSSVDGLMLGIQSTQVSSTVHIRMPIYQG